MSTRDTDRRGTDDPLVSRLEAALAHEPGHGSGAIACAWLFGSRARGTGRPTSDLDLAVLFSEDPPRTLEGLHLDLADRLTGEVGRPVDLVVMNRAPVDLVHRVLRDGILLLERDRSARIRFEVRARNEYFDLLPHLLRYRRVGHRAAEPVDEEKR
ncbi:type VII toxin-antitoxin system MntA family adenylyltransferase antitoxin [Thiocapsa rosea]|uniref:Nucleotidyltransferase-like protein n=1 Tax=Thiocapsa rosea TaxID=69360 RepID=A0A495V6X3_9GAMM|nr:nucleotidyltransferase domain-containing protein [Thiocapsa rosea]RKT45034.1 nucleotidyltransferase-like protein [Thiocapsa rosea]